MSRSSRLRPGEKDELKYGVLRKGNCLTRGTPDELSIPTKHLPDPSGKQHQGVPQSDAQLTLICSQRERTMDRVARSRDRVGGFPILTAEASDQTGCSRNSVSMHLPIERRSGIKLRLSSCQQVTSTGSRRPPALAEALRALPKTQESKRASQSSAVEQIQFAIPMLPAIEFCWPKGRSDDVDAWRRDEFPRTLNR